jgi:hypothetical protein
MKTTVQAKLLVLFAGVGLSIASAKTYHVVVPDHADLAGAKVKAGDYSVKIDGTKAILIGDENNKKIEANGSVQTADKKFSETTLEVVRGADGINHITAIDLGGTTTRLTFNN